MLDPANTLVYRLQPTKKVTPKERSIKDHLLLCNNTPSPDDFSDLVRKDKFSLEIKENFSRDKFRINVRGHYFVQYGFIQVSIHLLF